MSLANLVWSAIMERAERAGEFHAFAEGDEKRHKFSSTQFNIAECASTRTAGNPAEAILDMAAEIPDDELAEDGRENRPHVTIKYGLHTDNPQDVADVVAGFGSCEMTLGKVSIFAGKDFDVVKVDVLGDDIRELNKLIAESVECTDTHPTYIPHVTIAYVKPGEGQKYVGDDRFVGWEIWGRRLIFSDRDKNKTSIDLAPPSAFFHAFDESRGMRRPQEGERNSAGLVFHKGRWHREGEGDQTSQKVAKPDQTSPREPRKTPEERDQIFQSTRKQVAHILAGERTPEAAADLLKSLSQLTVKQLHAIKAEYNLHASGRKAELREKVGTRMMGHQVPAEQVRRPEAAKPPEPWAGKDQPEFGKVYNAPVSALEVDPKRFQFKLNTDAQGVTQEMKSVKTWNPDFAGVVSVWKDPETGKTMVVNGHHRRELAGRLGVKDMAVRYLNAKTAEEARAMGALINLAEGRGTAIDAAKFMRESKTGPAELEKYGVSIKGKLADDALQLTRLNDRIFDRVARGLFDPEKAKAIGKHLENPDLQNKLVSLLDKREEADKDTSLRLVEEMAREMAATPTHKVKTSDLFGDIENDESLFVERNELKAHVRAALSREFSDFSAVASKRRAERVGKEGKNKIDVEHNRQVADEAEQTRGVFDKLVNSKGAISDAVNAAAQQYALAKGKKAKDAVKQQVVESVRNAVEHELNGHRKTADKPPTGTKAEPKPPKPGFTGIDSHGHEWRDGEQVARGKKPGPGRRLRGKGEDGDSKRAGAPPADAADGGGKGTGGDGLKTGTGEEGDRPADKKEWTADDWDKHAHRPVDVKEIGQFKKLTPEERAVEDKAREYAAGNYSELRQKYLDAKNAKGKYTNTVRDSKGGIKSVTLNTDEWRGHLPGYKGTNAAAVHEPASWANKRLLDEMLHMQRGKGNNTFAMYGGGGGSGKSKVDDFYPKDKDPFPVISDQVADNMPKAFATFVEADRLGYKPMFIFVDRKPLDAWKGVVARAMNGAKGPDGIGRTVPLDVAMPANHDARKTALEILKTQIQRSVDPATGKATSLEIPVAIVDNTGGDEGGAERRLIKPADRQQAIAHIEKQIAQNEKNAEKDHEAAIAHVHDLFDRGEMSEEMARALLGKHFRGGSDERPRENLPGSIPVSGDDSGGTELRGATSDRQHQRGRTPGDGGSRGEAERSQEGDQSGVRGEDSTSQGRRGKTSGSLKTVEGAGRDPNAKPGDPPPKDKPITLVFGGSFSPIHKGHVASVEAAKKHLEDEGYKVSHVIVSPSPDKLLRAKLGDNLVPLKDRVQMAKAATADKSHISVTDKPAIEVENMEGKAKRTQLADWAATQYPDTTVVNALGEDALPGSHKPDKFPSAFASNEGHSGYYYLAMPRATGDSDISSSKIRKAVSEGKDVPEEWMNPETQKLYRKHLAAKEHAPNTSRPITKAGIDHVKKNLASGKIGVQGDHTSSPYVSAASGETLKRHVTLPTGAKVHPDELHRIHVEDDGTVSMGPENVGVKDPMNPGKTETHPSFERAVNSAAAIKGRDQDRVTIQSPHGFSAEKTRAEWRDEHEKLKNKPESFASWHDRENPPAVSEAAKNAPATEQKPASEKETSAFFNGGQPEQGSLMDYKTPALPAEETEATIEQPTENSKRQRQRLSNLDKIANQNSGGTRVLTDDQVAEFAETNGLNAPLSDDAKKALANYQESYLTMNRVNRGAKGYEDGSKWDIAGRNAAIDKAIEQTPPLKQPVSAFRGIDNDELAAALKPGYEFTDKAHSSTSLSRDYIKDFHGTDEPKNIVMQIRLPAGTKGAFVGSGENFKHECEYLLPRGAKFRVAKVMPMGKGKLAIVDYLGAT